jgi:hypothetical protein
MHRPLQVRATAIRRRTRSGRCVVCPKLITMLIVGDAGFHAGCRSRRRGHLERRDGQR